MNSALSHTFYVTGLSVKAGASDTDEVLARLEWIAEISYEGQSVSAAGLSYLRRSSKPDETPIAEMSHAQLIDWMVATEGGQRFIDGLLAGHEWMLLERSLYPSMQHIIGQPPAQSPVPPVVSRFQALAALSQAGYLDDVEAYMADPSTDPFEALAYRNAQEFQRQSPTVAKLQSLLGMTSDQLDDMFRFAATIYA